MGSVSPALEFQEPVFVTLSDEERISGRMTAENVARAVLGFHRDGLVVLENCVDTSHCDTLNEIMTEEIEELIKNPHTHFNDDKKAPAEKRSGNMQQKPPYKPDYMYEDIWANKAAATVLTSVLGPNPVCNFVDGNTALGLGYSGRQAVHADLAYNFPPGVPLAVCLNYYLEDVSSANGATEVWLGSAQHSTFRDHLSCRELRPDDDPTTPKRVNLRNPEETNVLNGHGVRDDVREARRAWAPPIQPKIKKGSVMIRDLKTWHAGIANPSFKPRVMLAFIHTPWWYKCPTKVYLPQDTKAKIDAWASREENPIMFNSEFLPTESACKNIDFGVDFSSRNLGYWQMLPKGLIPGYTFQAE